LLCTARTMLTKSILVLACATLALGNYINSISSPSFKHAVKFLS
jgi:hypothetical protein